MNILLRVIAILLALALPGAVKASMITYSMLSIAEESDVVFVGDVTSVAKDAATLTNNDVLFGKLDEKSVSVYPIHIWHCAGSSINFSKGERVLVFGKTTDDERVTVAGGGQGKISITPENREVVIYAAKRLMQIAPMEESEKNHAMLALARSENERLRAESHRYIVQKISHSKLRDEYKAELVSLVEDKNPDVQRTGLQGLQFVKAPELVLRMVELSRSEDLSVVSAASLALARYDNLDSMNALIELTKHQNTQIRTRAIIDLGNSRNPSAKVALIRLLDDPDPKIREMTPRGLTYWLWREEADDILPKLIEMLDDSEQKVRASAAHALGESRKPEMIKPLIAALKDTSPEDHTYLSIIRSIYKLCSSGNKEAIKLIDADISPFIDALKSGRGNNAYGPSFQSVGILNLSSLPEAHEALEWAAQSHPNKEVRAYATRCLNKKIQCTTSCRLTPAPHSNRRSGIRSHQSADS